MPKSAQNKGQGAKKLNLNFEFLNFVLIDYIFVYIEGFDSFHLDLL